MEGIVGWVCLVLFAFIVLLIVILLSFYMSTKVDFLYRMQCAIQRRLPAVVQKTVSCYIEQHSNELRGRRGLRGPKGCDGDKGPTGPAGSSLPFAEFIANMPLNNPAAILSGEAIEYPVNGRTSIPSTGSIIRYSLDPSRTFVLPNVGVYRVDHEATAESATLPGASPIPEFDFISNYAVIAANTITNTGLTVLHGSLALSPGAIVTGFPPGIVTGSQDVANAAALTAQANLAAASVFISVLPPGTDLTGQDMAGMVLNPGTYDWTTSATQSGGIFRLDGSGTYIFRIGTSLTTLDGSLMLMSNGAAPGNVYWSVGTSATMGANSLFYGNIITSNSITMGTGAVAQGLLGSMSADVILDTNQVFSRDEAVPSVQNDLINRGAQVVLSLAAGSLAPFVQLTSDTLVGIDDRGQLKSSPLVETTSVNSLLRVINPISGTLPLLLTPFAGGNNPVTARILITQLR